MSRLTRLYRALFLDAIVVLAAAAGLAGPAAAATITVNTTNDADAADGVCSLREAILAANDDLPRNECAGGNGPDRIQFALTTPAEIDLTADLPAITETLLIRGPGPAQLVIDGADLHRLLVFDTPLGVGGWLGVERLTLYRGRSPGGGGGDGGGAYLGAGETAWFERVWFVENRSANSAGGLAIGSAGSSPTSATLVECVFLGNVAEGAGSGGGLALIGTNGVARVIRSTLAFNEAAHENGTGGGILVARGTLHLEGSTVTGNRANGSGGGILLLISGPPPLSGALIVRDSTITGNVANADAVVGDTNGDGGGISFTIGSGFTGTLELHNSIVAGNADPEGVPLAGFQVHPDLHCDSNVQVIASGFSFVGSNEGCSALFAAGLPNAAGDWVGSAGAELDPILGVLADNGGPTPTHRPATAPTVSPLIDSGSCPQALEDQRGFGDATAGTRSVDVPIVPNAPGGDGCDVGALEVGATPNVDPTIFADGFEAGHTLPWTSEQP